MSHPPRKDRKASHPSSSELADAEIRLLPPQVMSGLPIALGYPHSYSVAMSNLGFHQVYRLFHERADVHAERFFWSPDNHGGVTFEGGRHLGGFRVVAFSLPYEVDYPRVLAGLRAAGIPLRRAERSFRDPFVLLGGIAITANPRPLAPLADMIVLGEAEEVLPRLLDLLVPALYEEKSRAAVLERIAGLRGLYIPAVAEDVDVQRVREPQLNELPTHSVFLTPHTVFRNTFLVELGRGCHRACAFCLTGNLMHGARMRSAESILQQVEKSGGAANKVGLVSPEVSSHSEIEMIVDQLIAMRKKVTLSSVETDRLSPRLISLLADAGLRTLTLAPECGTDQLRRRLRKTYTNQQILETVSELARTRIRKLKLYYLVGVPESDQDEVEAIFRLTADIAKAFTSSSGDTGRREVRVTLSPLVPKPFTPLAAHPMMPVRELRRRLRAARTRLAQIPGVKISIASASEAEIEYRIGVGDASTFEWLLGRTS